MIDDYDRSLAFYRDALGMEVTMEAGDGIYAELGGGGAILSLYRRDLMQQVVADARLTTGSGPVVTFEVDDVDATYVALRGRGVEFLTEPHDQPAWMIRVCHLADPDGNVIEINAPLGRQAASG
jgi:catechol 2,3-dioxygenase-like lactoylglutathione lyase family enzyme